MSGFCTDIAGFPPLVILESICDCLADDGFALDFSRSDWKYWEEKFKQLLIALELYAAASFEFGESVSARHLEAEKQLKAFLSQVEKEMNVLTAERRKTNA